MSAILLVALINLATTHATRAQQTRNGAVTIQSAPYGVPQPTPARPIDPRAAQSRTAVALPSATVPPHENSSGNSSGSWLWVLFGGLFVSAVGLSTTLFARVRKRRADDGGILKSELMEESPVASATQKTTPNGNYANGTGTSRMRPVTNKADRVINTWRTTSLPLRSMRHAPPASTAAIPTAHISEVNPFADAETNQATNEMPERDLTVATEARDLSTRQTAAASSFGAFRIEQEVSRLIQGEPHRLDILTSRSLEDRRAIEAMLMRCLSDRNASDDALRRARMALEEYGFVARRSAAMLCAPDALERAAAARSLGEIKSLMSLPFLLEALHDAEMAVRVEAVASVGALALPSAIGALLDAARRYPEIPASVLQKSLNACSVETEMYGDLPPALKLAAENERSDEMSNAQHQQSPVAHYQQSMHDASVPSVHRKLSQLKPSIPVESLPEWIEHESLYEALEQFQDADIETRVTAAVMLAQFQVQRAIEALEMMVMRDPEPRVRTAAVASLGTINHPSVFKPVLLALADEAREVRAASARALSRLTFDRAEAYVRVIENFDETSLREVAHACAKVGLAAQALERINSPDARQGYEACALLTLMAQAGYVAPLIQTVENHADINIRLAVAKLLGMMGNADVIEELRRVVLRADVPEQVRATIMEMIQHDDQMKADEVS